MFDTYKLKLRVAGIISAFSNPCAFICGTAPLTELVDTLLSIKSPSLFAKKLLAAFCVIKRVSDAPPGSLSPSPGSTDIASITTSETASFSAESSPTVTVFLNVMLPVLFSATIKSPTLKSPSSLVPEE